jgi:hypothetical protein
VDNGALADELAEWVRQEQPNFDWRQYGFQEFSELLNYAQDKGLVRNQADEETGSHRLPGRRIPSARAAARAGAGGRVLTRKKKDEPQPLVPGQPTATGEIPCPSFPAQAAAPPPRAAQNLRRRPAQEALRPPAQETDPVEQTSLSALFTG